MSFKQTMPSSSPTTLDGLYTEPKQTMDRLSNAIVWLKRSRRKNSSCRIVRYLETPATDSYLSLEPNRSCLWRNNSVRLLEELPPVLKESQLETLEIIAAGAFGRAVKVRHRQLGCVLVLKEVLNNSKENEETLVREVSLLRNLRHPNVLTCLAIVVRNKRLCLVTEYIDQGSVHQVLLNSPEDQPLPLGTRVSFAKDIAAGMAFIHENNVIHRDLTTHNCLARQDGSVVVSDFGLSKLIQPDPHYHSSLELSRCTINRGTSPSTSGDSEPGEHSNSLMACFGSNIRDSRKRTVRARRHTVVGSPFWMAPEMLAGKPYDQAVDVYSFGVIVCQLLAICDSDPEHIPRHSDTLSVDMDAFMDMYPNISKDEPPVLINTAKQCVSYNPSDRPTFASCRDWLNECLLYITSGKVPPEDIMGR